MNEIMPVPQADIVRVASVDPFEMYADEVAPRYIVGKLLRFNKGDYLAGENSEPMPGGTRCVAALDELMIGWIKWHGGKPVEHLMVRLADGNRPPKRDALGDNEEAQWELDENTGKRRDPWSFANYLPILEAAAGELFTFTTSTSGGLRTIGDLSRRYAYHRKRHPDVFPLITLGVSSYEHKDRQIGRVKYPDFAPAGYAPKTQFYRALEAAGIVPSTTPALIEEKQEDTTEEPPPVESEDDYREEVPW